MDKENLTDAQPELRVPIDEAAEVQAFLRDTVVIEDADPVTADLESAKATGQPDAPSPNERDPTIVIEGDSEHSEPSALDNPPLQAAPSALDDAPEPAADSSDRDAAADPSAPQRNRDASPVRRAPSALAQGMQQVQAAIEAQAVADAINAPEETEAVGNPIV